MTQPHFSMADRHGYRPDIDGLRGIAVLAVILYHAGYGAVGGGFIGVDIFFVLSGYLISSRILHEVSTGTFSLSQFYERRARRILPALFLVMLACVPLAWVWLPPQEMKAFSSSLIAVATFLPNVLFWRDSGYFDTAMALKPLAHTWSLGIEEQFYLFFPFLLMQTPRVGTMRVVGLIGLACLISLQLAQWGAQHKPAAAFFLLPTRVWELGIGALLAFPFAATASAQPGRVASQLLSLAGLAAILWAVTGFDESTRHPGYLTLVPVTGVVLVLSYARSDNFVGWLLRTRFLVQVGVLSYGAYLWHQPLFAFAKSRAGADVDSGVVAILIALTFLFAYLSWAWLEQPVRSRQLLSGSAFCKASAAASLLFIGVGLVGYANDGFGGRFHLPVSITSSFAKTDQLYGCYDIPASPSRSDWLCPLGRRASVPTFLLFGDSHAKSLFQVFDSAANQAQRSGRFAGRSGCTPFLGVFALRGDREQADCLQLNERVFAFVRDNNITDVFLAARWSYYTDGGYSGNNLSYLGIQRHDARAKDISRSAFAFGARSTAAAYARIGVRLHIIEQVPQQVGGPQSIYYRVFAGSAPDYSVLAARSVTREKHRALQSYTRNVFDRLPLVAISFDDLLCDPLRCLAGDSSGSFYADEDHLSVYGAARLQARIAAALR